VVVKTTRALRYENSHFAGEPARISGEGSDFTLGDTIAPVIAWGDPKDPDIAMRRATDLWFSSGETDTRLSMSPERVFPTSSFSPSIHGCDAPSITLGRWPRRNRRHGRTPRIAPLGRTTYQMDRVNFLHRPQFALRAEIESPAVKR